MGTLDARKVRGQADRAVVVARHLVGHEDLVESGGAVARGPRRGAGPPSPAAARPASRRGRRTCSLKSPMRTGSRPSRRACRADSACDRSWSRCPARIAGAAAEPGEGPQVHGAHVEHPTGGPVQVPPGRAAPLRVEPVAGRRDQVVGRPEQLERRATSRASSHPRTRDRSRQAWCPPADQTWVGNTTRATRRARGDCTSWSATRSGFFGVQQEPAPPRGGSAPRGCCRSGSAASLGANGAVMAGARPGAALSAR